jgi:hypothetical protein
MRMNPLRDVSLFFLLIIGCNPFGGSSVKNIKDLDDNMIDIRMYHENLGDAIVKTNRDEALWLYAGMDSVLMIVAMKFDEHRKLVRPFRDSYEKDLLPEIGSLGKSLEMSDWPAARTAYTALTRKCNGCHRDREVDKVVQNWLERGK